MNIRKYIDYTEMYKELDLLMLQDSTNMELYCEIGKIVCHRTEKGAAVMASEYLNKHYPDVKGFSPRILRRMRDFHRTYENHPTLLSRAMQIGWIQNVIIMEADLTMDLREWYMKATKHFAWSKTELVANLETNAHNTITLTIEEDEYEIVDQEKNYDKPKEDIAINIKKAICQVVRKNWQLRLAWKDVERRLYTLLWEILRAEPTIVMRC